MSTEIPDPKEVGVFRMLVLGVVVSYEDHGVRGAAAFVLATPILATILLLAKYGPSQSDLAYSDEEKVRKAKERSSKIDDWSELKSDTNDCDSTHEVTDR